MSLISIINMLSGYGGGGGSTPPPGPITYDTILFVFSGESNSGGFAQNTELTSPELAARSSVKIFNNNTSVFEDIDIGTNNLLGHTGIAPGNTHGWEAGLADEVEAGSFTGLTQVHLVKTGQGGSYISEWNVGGSYWNTMISRINAAKTLLDNAGKTYKIIFWYSQGINDMGAAGGGTADATWKSATIAHFAAIRGVYGYTLPIIMTKFMSPATRYNYLIDEIDAADAYTKAIDVTGASVNNITTDPYHWNAAGLKVLADRMKTETLTFF